PAARAARTATLTAGLDMLVPQGGLGKNDARIEPRVRCRLSDRSASTKHQPVRNAPDVLS
ncbi:MAG TPA: hypothetical protein VGO25_02025, partial [Rhodanobacteraceae bacterium]|nr:hypothetical protein [Rhodanobacteraceae bacterium]